MLYCNYRKNGVKVDLGTVRGRPHVDYFYDAFGVPEPGKTMIEDVDEVPPVLPNPADHEGKTDGALVDELRTLIVDSVSRTPINAVSLSGGLDSAIVAAVAKPKIVFSCSYTDYDELEYARTMAAQVGAEHVVVRPTEVDARTSLPEIVAAVGQPTFPSSAVGCWKLCHAMQEHGIHDVADGTGPDELFGGYVRYLLLLTERVVLDCSEFRNYGRMLARFWGSATQDVPARRYYNLLRSGGMVSGPPFDFVAAQFAAAHGLVEAMTRVDLQLGMRGFVGMTDGCARAHGISWHSPLFSDEIVSFALGLPDRLKTDPHAAMAGRTATKVLLRRVARTLGVPDQIIDRTDKQGWVTPIARWFNGPLAGWVAELRESIAPRGYAARSDPSRGEFDQSTFADVCLALWLQRRLLGT